MKSVIVTKQTREKMMDKDDLKQLGIQCSDAIKKLGICDFDKSSLGQILVENLDQAGYQITKKPEAWNGEGLPPVGTQCEVSNCGNPFEFCEIKYIGSKVCVVDHDAYDDQHYHLSSVKFRPIRTEEEKLLDQLIKDARREGDESVYRSDELKIAKQLIAAGWRPNN